MSAQMVAYGSELNQNEIAIKSIESWGPAIKDKVYYGVYAPMDGPGMELKDWRFDGLKTLTEQYRNAVKAHKGDVGAALKTLKPSDASTLTFNPEIIRPLQIDEVKRRTPALSAIQKLPLIGKTVNEPIRTAGVQPIWTAGDGAALTGLDQTFTPKTADVAYLNTPGSVSGGAQKLTESSINLLAESRQGHMMDHMQFKSQVLFRGDASGSSNVASAIDLSGEPSNVSGIYEVLEDDSRLIDLDGQRGINIGDIEVQYEEIEDLGGVVGVTYTDRKSWTRLRKEASAAGRIDFNTPNFGFGLRQFNIDTTPVIWEPALSSATGERSAVSIDFRAIAEYVQLNAEMVNVAQQMADKTEFFIRNYFTFLVRTSKWMFAHVDAK